MEETILGKFDRTSIIVDLDIIRSNLCKLKENVSGKNIMAVVKMDGYGHGAYSIAKYTSDIACGYALATAEEALGLRDNGIDAYLFSELESVIQSFDIIINTVPYPVIPSSALNSTKKEAYISELASKPGGYDHEYARKIDRSSYILRGLPGICAPESAGAALGKCIISYIENGVTRI